MDWKFGVGWIMSRGYSSCRSVVIFSCNRSVLSLVSCLGTPWVNLDYTLGLHVWYNVFHMCLTVPCFSPRIMMTTEVRMTRASGSIVIIWDLWTCVTKAWFSLATQAQAQSKTQAMGMTQTENEIRRKHKHKQNHPDIPNCLCAR